MASSPVIDKFLDAISSAAIPGSDLWSADAMLDATVPNWRMHVTGPDAIRAEYAVVRRPRRVPRATPVRD